mmetsp:Transcript_26971/g.46495  ORF Transcript_26971/g.46495 Transcript_26971/m.46495 type:complete len:279 (+) Transcript_26971:62-898(+)
MSENKDHGAHDQPRWLSTRPSKRWGELFFLYYSPIWISLVAVIVGTRMFEKFTEKEYMITGLLMAVPCIAWPVLFPGQPDKMLPLKDRYVIKANLWIIIMSFIGNYFWTHYFYNLLGATYTFPAWRINDVPFMLILATHAYFCTYHVFTNLALRRWYTSRTYKTSSRFVQLLVTWTLVAAMSYFTAWAETVTIEQFPYYTFKDRSRMYTVGSIVYGIYFIVSFPMFYRLDEEVGDNWSLSKTALDSFACCMIVTCLLDFWRLVIGGIVDDVPRCVPWM